MRMLRAQRLTATHGSLSFDYRTLAFAGTESTSAALSRTLQTLAERQDVQDELRREVINARNGQDISYDALMELPLLNAVCKETLRL